MMKEGSVIVDVSIDQEDVYGVHVEQATLSRLTKFTEKFTAVFQICLVRLAVSQQWRLQTQQFHT